MCGRFTSAAKAEDIEREFKVGKVNPQIFTPRYNIAPSQEIPAVLEQGGEKIIVALKWGLIPHWSKDDSIASKLINARAENFSEKASFSDAFRLYRRITPATGFYEWDNKSSGEAKQPYYFYLMGQRCIRIRRIMGGMARRQNRKNRQNLHDHHDRSECGFRTGSRPDAGDLERKRLQRMARRKRK